jgi:hypothetical protein
MQKSKGLPSPIAAEPFPSYMWDDNLKTMHKEAVTAFNRFLKGLPKTAQLTFWKTKKTLHKEVHEGENAIYEEN